ncbi:hypothetical protein F5B22DRAFT_230195 [Xylaria bambusicola]|uniref:uncharacterized protein n=1 Tax=Xylaria bambusicola TaxID=326684 RepID=UPI002008CBE3|nr:uncharacterized protein F5B22DRAFT_230195 [Xylaria bambusicola]KAI0514497.1 hypothetical protein F5B22DRAFT_230195 [Xylaria bambusicola]
MLQSSQPPVIPATVPTSTSTLTTGNPISSPALPRKMPLTSGWSLHVTVYIAPDNVDRFLAAFKPVFNKVVAEPECLFFEMYQSPQEPGKLSWVENWSKSPEWFLENQVTKDYYKEYFAITEAMFTKPREFQFLERVGPDYFMVKDRQFTQ